MELSDHQEKVLNSMKLKILGQIPKDEEATPPIKKRKGPNPMSCKKKKNRPETTQDEQSKTVSSKRKRKRIRIPHHVKQELLANCGT